MRLLNAMTRESRLHLARVDLNGTSRLPIYKPSDAVDRVAATSPRYHCGNNMIEARRRYREMTQSDPPASLLQFLQQNARRLLPLRVELCCLNRAVRTSASRFLFGTDGRRADLDARDTPRKVGQSRSGRSMALKPLAHPGRPGRGSASAFGQVFDRRDFCVRGIAPVYRHDAWSARHIRWGDCAGGTADDRERSDTQGCFRRFVARARDRVHRPSGACSAGLGGFFRWGRWIYLGVNCCATARSRFSCRGPGCDSDRRAGHDRRHRARAGTRAHATVPLPAHRLSHRHSHRRRRRG